MYVCVCTYVYVCMYVCACCASGTKLLNMYNVLVFVQISTNKYCSIQGELFYCTVHDMHWIMVKTLAANAGGRGFESHRGQNLFFTIYSIL